MLMIHAMICFTHICDPFPSLTDFGPALVEHTLLVAKLNPSLFVTDSFGMFINGNTQSDGC